MFNKINRDNAHEYARMCEVFYHSPAVAHSISKEIIERNINRFIQHDDCEGYLLRYEAQWVGYVLVSYMFSTETGKLDAWLEELYISDEFRGHGLGTKVLEELSVRLKEKCGRIRLEVTKVNRGAIALYERHGFSMSPYQQMVLTFDEAV